MKLYYSPGACSLAPHIVAREGELAIELEKVDLRAGKTEGGKTFTDINPKGYVPALALDNGELLTEAAAVLQYLGDQAPKAKLIPECGTFERYRVVEWLTFVSSEMHKGFSPLWKPNTPDAMKDIVKETLQKRFAVLDKHLAKNKFLAGDQFTVADAYLFTVMNWRNPLKIDISAHKNLGAYLERVAARPKVKEAMEAEGLLKKAA